MSGFTNLEPIELLDFLLERGLHVVGLEVGLALVEPVDELVVLALVLGPLVQPALDVLLHVGASRLELVKVESGCVEWQIFMKFLVKSILSPNYLYGSSKWLIFLAEQH